MQTVTATNARNNFFTLLKKILEAHAFVKVKGRSGNIVLLSEQDYEELLETAEISVIPGIKESIKEADKDMKNGDVYSLDEAFSV